LRNYKQGLQIELNKIVLLSFTPLLKSYTSLRVPLTHSYSSYNLSLTKLGHDQIWRFISYRI